MDNSQVEREAFKEITDFVSGIEFPSGSYTLEYAKRTIGKDGPEIEIPFIAKGHITAVNKDGSDEERPVYPAYVKNIEDGNINAATTNILKEIELLLNSEMTFKHRCLEGPIAVCANVKEGTFQLDFTPEGRVERIVVNESWGEDRAIDADGDRCFLLWKEGSDYALIIKWPITKRPSWLRYVRGRAREHFYSFGLEDTINEAAGETLPGIKTIYEEYALPFWYGRGITPDDVIHEGDEKFEAPIVYRNGQAYILQDEKKAFFKSHEPVEVGLLTSNLNSEELFNTLGMKFEEKCATFMEDPKRFEIIEKGALKGARKDFRTISKELFTFKYALKKEKSWALTSSNSITKQKPKDLNWLLSANLDKVTEDLLMLRLKRTDFFRTKSTASASETEEPVVVDMGLISRLIKTNRLRIDYAKHLAFPFDAKKPLDTTVSLPVVAIYLTLPTGEIVGLTDNKKSDGRLEGLTYCYLLPPVWDATIERYIHPIHHMAKEFACKLGKDEYGNIISVGRFDSRIINPVTSEIVALFGSNVGPLGEPVDHFLQYSVKVPMLAQAIAEYCGEYGIPADGDRTKTGITPSSTGIDTAIKSVIVDYGKDSSADEMYQMILKADKVLRLSISGNKQTKRRVRKYPIAHKNGVAIWAPPNSHISRPGKQLAQRARALKKCTMKVAILLSDSKSQAYITPSGVEKQKSDRAFLPRNFPTFEKWKQYILSSTNEQDDLPQPEVVTHPTWNGELRRVWIAGARASIELGKLIDDFGNKFMPRRILKQVKSGNDNIDILFPITELLSKGAVRAMLGQEIPTHLIKKIQIPVSTTSVREGSDKWIPGNEEIQEVTEYVELEAIVLDSVFYRTGSASENIPARRRWCSIKGFDKYCVISEMQKVTPTTFPTPNTTTAKELQKLAQRLRLFLANRKL